MSRTVRFPLLILFLVVLMLPLLIQAQEDDLEIPMPPGAEDDELVIPLVPDNAVVAENGDVLIIGTANPPTEELIEYPVTPGAGADPCAPTGDEQVVPLVDCPTVTPAPTQQQPITLIHGYYRQVSTSMEQEGICYDTSVDAMGVCAADPEGHNEVYDYNNCWSADADADGDGVRDEHLVPACQSPDTELLYLFNEGYLFGRLSGRAYGRASMNRTMLEQGGVSIGTYSVLQGTQIEILSPTRFVVRQVHRENNGGCVRIFNMFYELAGESEAACQQVIEVAPDAPPEEPISTPPPLPPVSSEPYRVSMPIIPDTCTQDTLPPADFTQAQLALDNRAGMLTVSYGSGVFTTYQHIGSTFSFVDQRQGVFRLDFTLFDGRVDMKWYKSNGSASCTVEGELRPVSADASAPAADSPMAAIEDGATYNVTWTPLPDACPAEMRALTPDFTQATVTTESDRFTIDYGAGSFTLLDEYGIGMYSYTVYGEDGSTITIILNSYTPELLSLTYQHNNTSGNVCLTTMELSPA